MTAAKNSEDVVLNIHNVYNQLAIFFLGTISLILAIVTSPSLNKDPQLNALPQALFLIFVICYFFNTYYFSLFYLTKANKLFRETYEKHPHTVLRIAVVILLLIILSLQYIYFGWEKLVDNVFSIFVGAAITLLFTIKKKNGKSKQTKLK